MKQRNHFTIIGKIIVIIIITAIILPLSYINIVKIYQGITLGNHDAKIFSLSTSEDKYSNSQWYIDNTGFYSSYSMGEELYVETGSDVDMNVSKAWERINKAKSAKREVVVAVIDTGIDYTHPDLAKNMWMNKGEVKGDHKDNDHNGYIDDVYGWDFYNNDASTCHYDNNGKAASFKDNDNHGSHIAGIIAAVANNKIGIAGIASNVNIKIMTLKINGGPNASGKMSNAIKAINYASKMGADICNISWGTTENSAALKAAMQKSNMLFVTAAGNSGTNNDKKHMYPADFSLKNMITVTAINAAGKLSNYSNYGKKTVEIAAPGNDIFSTFVGGYGSMSGSSMAAPQVTSVAAMLYASNDHLYASNVKKIILGNLKAMPDLKGRIKYAGIPDAYKAVKATDKLIQDTKAPSLMVTYVIANNKNRTVTVKASDMQSGLNQIKYLQGIKKSKDFLASGTAVNLKKGQGTFKISKDGIYTIFASDYAGNLIVKSITVKSVKTDQLKLTKTTLKKSIGESYNLKNKVKPYNSTDTIYYQGSNKTRVNADSTKKVTALSKESVYTTAKKRSGTKAIGEAKVNLDG